MKKIILSLLLVFNWSAVQSVQLQDSGDKQGRTPLMILLVERQTAMDKKMDTIYYLWHECFAWETFLSSCNARKQYSFSVKKFEALLAAERDLKQCLADTLIDIDTMIKNGAQINTQNIDGKTVLDYCEYKVIHDYLIARGAMLGAEMVFFSNREDLLLSGFVILSIPFVIAAIIIINSYQEDWE